MIQIIQLNLKKLLFLFLLLHVANSFALLSVKSFRKLDLHSSSFLKDQLNEVNSDSSAIIRVITPLVGITDFNCGIKSVNKIIQMSGEILIFVQPGADYISLSHINSGVIKDYKFVHPLEKHSVYELVITSENDNQQVSQEINSQWLLIRPKPINANILIDKVLVKTGEYTGKYKPGTYSYTVEAPLYHPSSGSVTITDKNVELNVELESAFGYIYVSTSPEEGASVYVDGKLLSNVTPCKSAPLASGEHSIQVMKELHQVESRKVYLDDDKTTKLSLVLQPNFATVTLKSNSNSTVFVNGQPKGTGVWTGRLNAGVYSIEASLEGYQPIKKDIELLEGESREIDMQLTPIMGNVNFSSIPEGAKIFLDGKECGVTPQKYNDLLVGEHTLKLIKDGYVASSQKFTIEENKNLQIDETLVKGISVKIETIPNACNLFVDGEEVGPSPYSGVLSVGNHIVSVFFNKNKVEKIIKVSDTSNNFELSFTSAQKNLSGTTKFLKIDMVSVKGGTFTMGELIPENIDFPSVPKHEVSVNDFYIGTTEVTQLQWKSVMGVNPSKFQGDSLPVDDVSWNLVQEFILKLNKMSGKSYRLPTEAEWEYAAGGGSQNRTIYSGTNVVQSLDKYAWILENSNNRPHNVATKLPNRLGLFDMSGNVWEWCSDWMGTYPKTDQDNPTGPATGLRRVNRGGSWKYGTISANICGRGGYDPGSCNNRIGFRLAMSK